MGEKRRAESDARLEYIYSFLSDATSLSRHEVSESIHDALLVPKINTIFQANSPKTLLLYHQHEVAEPPPPEQPGKGLRGSPPKQLVASTSPKNKLFQTDGSKPLKGVAIYYVRPFNDKPITEENYSKEIICGTIDNRRPGGLLRNIYKTLQYVFIPALMGLADSGDDSEADETVRSIVRKRLVPALRSYCSALSVWEAIQVESETLLITEKAFTGYESADDLRRYAKTPDKVKILERTIKQWISVVSQIVAESFRLRKEVDSNGPQDEVEYWKQRASLLAMLEQKVHGGEMRFTILTLSMVGSNALKVWKSLENKVSYVLNEAKDISAYIDRIDHTCHPLYLDNPGVITKTVNGLMQTVMLIQTSSMFYNTSEKISHLMVKITNQMIHRCKTYLTHADKQTVWSQKRADVHKKILECIQLNKMYRKRYKFHYEKTRPKRDPEFCISEHYVFGKFDAFCERLRKIIVVFETLDGYESLFKTHVCGLLWDDSIDEKEKEFTLDVKLLTGKDYNYLDYRNKEFDADFSDFLVKVEELRLVLNKMIEKNYHSIWESPQAIKFLKRIEEVNKYVDITSVEDKYDRIANYFINQIRTNRANFKKKKRRDNIPRGMPPVAGKIMWIRAMVLRLESFTKEFAAHPKLNQLPQYRVLVKEYNSFLLEVATFEIRFLKKWQNECKLITVEEPLRDNILAYQMNERPMVNLSPVVESSMAEGDSLVKLGAEIPLPTKVVLLRTIHFRSVSDKLEMLLDQFATVVKKVKKEVRPLLFSQTLRLAALFHPAMTTINWTSSFWEEYYKNCLRSIEDFNTLLSQVHDIFEYQIKGTFHDMECYILCAPFFDVPWTLDDFLDKNYKAVREITVELNEKSLRVRDLVDEVIALIAQFGSRIGRVIIQQFELEKQMPFLSEVLDLSTPEAMTPDRNGGGSATGFGKSGLSDGGYGSPGNQRNQPDWSIVDHLFESPHLIYGVMHGKISKEIKELAKNASEDVKTYFSRQVFDIIIHIIKTSLGLIRRRFVGSKGSKKASSMFISSKE